MLQTGHDSKAIKTLTRTHDMYVHNPEATSQYIILRITVTVVTTVQLQGTLFHLWVLIQGNMV